MINIIVPFSRPQFLDNVTDNFKRQNYPDKKLIVVENGEGIGFFANTGCTVLSSGCHHALAKNEAITWIKRNGGGWWVTMDDDDYYGPNYVTEVVENISNADVLGKSDRFFKDEDNLYLMDGGYENEYVFGVLGATLAARAEDSCELKEETHDDVLFCQDMVNKGARIYATSKFHFVHSRYNGIKTSWDIDVQEMAQNALDTGQRVLRWRGIPLDIINGLAKIDGYTEVERDRSVPPKRLKNQGMSFENLVRSYGIEPDPKLLSSD